MRKFRLLALFIATIMLLGCFASCNKTDEDDEGGEDSNVVEGPSITVDIMVNSGVDVLEKSLNEELVPIVGDTELSIPVTEGSQIKATDVLSALINKRKAGGINVSVTFTSSGGVDEIKLDNETYRSGRELSERTGTEKRGDSDETYAVYYYDVYVWEWTCNGEVIESVKDREIKNGDKLVLTLVYDNTSEEGFEPIETGE